MSSRSRRSGWWLALAALAMVCLQPGIAGGKDAAPALPEGSHIIKIGPQATVLVDEEGNARMYEDPAEEAPSCKSRSQCWGRALGILAFFGLLTYEELTSSNEGGSRMLQRVGPAD